MGTCITISARKLKIIFLIQETLGVVIKNENSIFEALKKPIQGR